MFGDGIIWKELNFPNKKLPWKCHSCWNDFLNSPLFMKVAKLLWKWCNWHLLFQVLLYVQTSCGQTKQGAACLSELMRNDRLVICPFLSQKGDGVSINQVFMCQDVFCKSSSILGRWSRTSQWKAGPRDDSHKVTFWDICLCDVINGDEDFFCNTSSRWSITKTPIITSVLPPTESVVLHQNEGNARFVAQWGFLSSMASCQMMWSQYWHHTVFFFGERSDDVRWKHYMRGIFGNGCGDSLFNIFWQRSLYAAGTPLPGRIRRTVVGQL